MTTAPDPAGPGQLPEPTTSPERAREAAEAVLARPEYAEARPNLLERAWQTVVDWLVELLSGLDGLPGVEWVGLAVLAAGAAAAGWLASIALRRVRRSAGSGEVPVALEGRDAAAWRAEAAAHETAGAWRKALRCHYRALLAELVAAGRVDEVPGRTAREYLAQAAAGDPALRAPLGAATDAFEAAWYGHAPADREQAARMAAHADEVRRLAGAGAGRAERPLTARRGGGA